MEIHAVNLVYDFCLMSVLLFLSKIIRIKVKVVQTLFVPSALIAGFLGLILGEQGFNILPFSGEMSSYPGILIAVLFASMFLGKQEKISFQRMISNVGDTFFVNAAAEMSQFGLFIIIGSTLLPALFSGIQKAFGLMLPAGFIGGHGTAAAVGEALGASGWEEALSVGQTFATIGLLGGIGIGIILVNIGLRKGYVESTGDIKDLLHEMSSGLVPEEERQSIGDATVNPMSIDPLTWHLALILIAVGAAYLVNMGLKALIPSLAFPLYGLALLCSVVLQRMLKLIKMDSYVDRRVITHIGSSATDYLIAFGIATTKISVVVKYAWPILFLSALGFLFVVAWHFIVSRRFFRDHWYERSLYIFGMSSGVMATGVILLRIVDPDFRTGVLEDFGVAWIFMSVVDLLIVSLAPALVMSGYGLLFGICLLVLAALSLFTSGKRFGVYRCR